MPDIICFSESRVHYYRVRLWFDNCSTMCRFDTVECIILNSCIGNKQINGKFRKTHCFYFIPSGMLSTQLTSFDLQISWHLSKQKKIEEKKRRKWWHKCGKPVRGLKKTSRKHVIVAFINQKYHISCNLFWIYCVGVEHFLHFICSNLIYSKNKTWNNKISFGNTWPGQWYIQSYCFCCILFPV